MGAFSHPIFQIFVLGTSFNLLSEPVPPKDANLHYHHYLPQVAFLPLFVAKSKNMQLGGGVKLILSMPLFSLPVLQQSVP